jgi:hypothetical protein
MLTLWHTSTPTYKKSVALHWKSQLTGDLETGDLVPHRILAPHTQLKTATQASGSRQKTAAV